MTTDESDRSEDALTLLAGVTRQRTLAYAALACMVPAILLVAGLILPSAPLVLSGVFLGMVITLVGFFGFQSRQWLKQARLIVENHPLVPCSITALAAPDGGRHRPYPRAAVRIDSPSEYQGPTYLVVSLPRRALAARRFERTGSLARRVLTPTSLGTYESGTRPVHATALVAGLAGAAPIVLVDENFNHALLSIPVTLPSERETIRRISG